MQNFLNISMTKNIQLHVVASNHHEENETIERANQTLRMTYRRLQSAGPRSRLDDLVLEARYGKSLIRGSKLAPAVEILNAAPPQIIDNIDSLMPPPFSDSTQAAHIARDSVNLVTKTIA